jgi:AraC-like DNA-binding protein
VKHQYISLIETEKKMPKNDQDDIELLELSLENAARRFTALPPLVGVIYNRGEGELLFTDKNQYLEFCFELSPIRRLSGFLCNGKQTLYVAPHVWIRDGTYDLEPLPEYKIRNVLVLRYEMKYKKFFRKNISKLSTSGYSFVITSRIKYLLNEINYLIAEKNDLNITDHLDMMAFELICESLMNVRESLSSNPISSGEYKWKLLLEAAIYIDTNFRQELDIDTVCNNFCVSRRTLFRYWKRHFNSTPAAYIAEKRLRLAVQLLSEKKMLCSEISQYCGFSSHSYFCAAFRKKYGKAPTEYFCKNRSILS